MKKSLLALLVGGMLFTTAHAQTTWKVDKSHSNVDFTVTHLVISEVRGNFKDFDVTITQPNEDFTKSSIEASIKTATINTDNENRDKHLRANDFLNAEKFPEMKFKSTAIKQTGKDTYAITGNLTIRDVTKPVVLDTKFLGNIVDPWGNTKTAFKATTTIDRFVFGTTWDKKIETGGLVVGKEVGITLNLAMVKQKSAEKQDS